MDTIASTQPSTKVVERFVAGYWSARTRANHRFILDSVAAVRAPAPAA